MFLQQTLLTQLLGFVLKSRFLFVTTSETETGVLLIEQFKTLINHKIVATRINSEWPLFIVQAL